MEEVAIKFYRFALMFLVLPAFIVLLSQNVFASTENEVSANEQCLKCHLQKTPQIVTDWQLSSHSQNDVTCSECHETQVDQFKKGKHGPGVGRNEGHALISLATDAPYGRHEKVRRMS